MAAKSGGKSFIPEKYTGVIDNPLADKGLSAFANAN